MDRRDFIKKASVGGLGLAMSNQLAAAAETTAANAAGQPNILFIMVDQFRFPSVFPQGVNNAAEFIQRFMPNTYSLWQKGVKFTQHFGGSSACTPSRGVMVTGLYSQQTWVMQTLKNSPGSKVSLSPVLHPGFPTYGKLLREVGYQTPYIGKWHLNVTHLKKPLEPYGFEGLTEPDPTGANLQGTVGDAANGYLNDEDIANQATQWLQARKETDKPWCLTVSFINPHDHEFFWAGTEFQTFNNLFNNQTTYQPFGYYSSNNGTDYPPVVPWDKDILKNPPQFGYPAVPANWETAARLKATKPSTQTFLSYFNSFVWGGVTDNPSVTDFSIQPYPGVDGYGYAVAPYSYWRRNLDSYTQTLRIVDRQIGKVLGSLRQKIAKNTVIVFVSDHGDYVGAHGLVTNKAATAYDEAFHVPLIVVDPTGQFAGDIDIERKNLTSSVDLLNLLVSIGNNGKQDWLRGPYAKIYGSRHNMIPMLKSAKAPGRPYILFATDELVPASYNFNQAPMHIVAMRTKSEKIAAYSDWRDFSSNIVPKSTQVEYYDYQTARGRAELDNDKDNARVPELLKQLLTQHLPNEIRAPLPGPFGEIQKQAKTEYLLFAHLMQNPPDGFERPEILRKWLGYGNDY